jgi:hypothetical protein
LWPLCGIESGSNWAAIKSLHRFVAKITFVECGSLWANPG